MEMLVPVGVVLIKNVPVVIRPMAGGDRPLLFTRNGDGLREIVDRRDPDIQHTINRRKEAEPFAVRADASLSLLRVTEQRVARDQWKIVELAGRVRRVLDIRRLSRGVRRPQAEQQDQNHKPETQFKKHSGGAPEHTIAPSNSV